MGPNTLFHGDNLDVLRRHVTDQSVDLVYLDPPFKSNQNYDVLFEQQDGTRPATRFKAFKDTWRWDEDASRAYGETVEAGGPAAKAMLAFRALLGDSDMLAYLAMMGPRLVELRRVLKSTGSIYLHCDASASHYLKVLMDAIYGPQNFRREIIWRSGWVSGFKTRTRNWIRNHDTLLYYRRDGKKEPVFNKELAYQPHEAGYQRRGGGGNTLGVALDDVWDDVALYSPWIKSFSQEKLGYMTQKPQALLERIISVSSNKNDVVLDPFSGCGTTIAAAQNLGRRWIGIDISHLSINLIRYRLRNSFALDSFRVVGGPVSLADAEALAQADSFDFQCWALGLLGARTAGPGKEDIGIAGRLTFDDKSGTPGQALLSVNSGAVTVRNVRDFGQVVKREKAELGVLVTLREVTRQMRAEAAGQGHATSRAGMRPRIQILTVSELLSGKKVDRF